MDTTPPQIISVSSSNADGIYRDAYDNITIQITFSEKVVIHNINSDNISTYPAILMETGSKDGSAFYSSGNNSSILSFIYTIQPADSTSDLNYKNINSFMLNSSRIKDTVSLNANLELPEINSHNSLASQKGLVVNSYLQFGASKIGKSAFSK